THRPQALDVDQLAISSRVEVGELGGKAVPGSGIKALRRAVQRARGGFDVKVAPADRDDRPLRSSKKFPAKPAALAFRTDRNPIKVVGALRRRNRAVARIADHKARGLFGAQEKVSARLPFLEAFFDQFDRYCHLPGREEPRGCEDLRDRIDVASTNLVAKSEVGRARGAHRTLGRSG